MPAKTDAEKKSELKATVDKFFGDGQNSQRSGVQPIRPVHTASGGPRPNSRGVDKNSESFKRNAARFADGKDPELASQGSIFQKNAAKFYDMEKPAKGERPFEIKKPSAEDVANSKGFSILNEQKVKAHVS